MKTLKRVFTTLAAIGCFGTVMAATPVVVWDGDFGTSVKTGTDGKTYTLTLPSGADSWVQSDGTLKIGSGTQAANITVAGGVYGEKLSILMEYSGATAQNSVVPLYVNEGAYFGLRTKSGSASLNVVGHFWNNGNEYPTSGDVVTAMPENGSLLFVFPQGTVEAYSGATRDALAGGAISGLSFSNKTLGNIGLGGCFVDGSSKGLNNFENLVIKKVAIFNSAITTSDVASYTFPSEVPSYNITVSKDMTWSEILADPNITSETKLVITAENNPKITFDNLGNTLYGLTISGAATIVADDDVYGSGAQCFGKTLLSTSAAGISMPNVTFEVKAGWKGEFAQSTVELKLYAQNAETISINIGGGGDNTATVQPSPEANLVSGPEYVGLYPTPGTAWNNISGHWTGGSQTVTLTSAKAFDGKTTTVRNTVQLSGKANNTWGVGTAYTSFLRGYLDDTGGIEVKIVGVPYSEYDVIIYATSDSNLQLNYFTINDVNYTCGSDGIATEGTGSWGVGQTTTPTLGKNAMLVQGVTGSTLTISGTRAANNGPRVTVCAVQIINKGVVESSDWSANLDATTTFSGGTGAGLSGQSGTWVNSALASITVTNKASDVTLTLDGEITAGSLKIVGGEGKRLTIDKDSGATLDIAVYDLTETEEETTFLFDPDFSKVNAGDNLIGVGFDYEGAIASGRHYTGSNNALTLGDVNGGSVIVGGAGTISGDLGISGDATVTFSGDYTSSGDVMLGATKGVLNIAEGASVSVPHVRLVNSGSSVACTMNVDGALAVTSVSSGSNVYNERNNYKGILFGHYYGSSTVNVGATGSITGEAAWMQLTYTAPNTMTIDGGSVKVRGINGGSYGSDGSSLTLTGGGTIEVAEGFVNMGRITRDYGYGTIKTYSYNESTGWTDSGAITFTDTTKGTTIDPCGMADVFSGALSGDGKIVVSDSVGGGSVSFTGASNNLTGDIVVASGSTLNLGTTRPTGTMTIAGAISLVLSDKAEVPVLKVSANTANITLYDTDGTTVLEGVTIDYDDEAGTITVKPPMPKWTTQSDSGSFDADANWSTGSVPTSGDAVIELSQDTAISISGTYELSSLTITGTGTATLSGEGTVTVGTVYVIGGTSLAHSGQIAAVNISLDSGTVLKLDGVTESAAISGAGAVETYGDVTMSAANTFTGGITAKTGTLSTTTASGFGKDNSGSAYSALSQITVEDGACVDLKSTKDHCYAITIAGKGVQQLDGTYSGAVKNTGVAMDSNSRQTASLTLTADAMVDVSSGWGLVQSSHNAAYLALNGHTLTFSGAGTVPMVNVNASNSAGTLVLDGATLYLGSTACNFTGVNIVAKGCASIDLATAPSALDSLTLKPTASGTTASAWNLPEGLVPVVDATNVDTAGLTDGQELTLFTAPATTELSASTINAKINGRYTTTISGNTVKATYHAGLPGNFLHYIFNEGAAVNTGAASDSGTTISSVGEAGSVTLVESYNGKAVQVHTGYTPYWDTYANGTSPFHGGEVTVTTLAKIDETNIILWGLGGAAANKAMGLVVTDEHTAKVVAKKGTADIVTLATATVEQNLTSGWHFFAVVSDESGTKLYVDDNAPTSTTTGIPAGVGQAGQLGSFHGGAFGANKVSADGYYLDDWRVYDAALTADEVAAIRTALTTAVITIAETEHGTVTVKQGETPIASGTRVARGTTVTITLTPVEGYKIDDVTVVMGGVDITETLEPEETGDVATADVTITADTTVTVTFAAKAVSFTVAAVPNTTVKVMEGENEVEPKNGVYTVQAGAQVKVIWVAADGYIVTTGETDWFTPTANQPVAAPEGMKVEEIVAKIGDTPYTSLQAAIDAATEATQETEGDTITLLKAVTDALVLEKAVTIDTNGYTAFGTGIDITVDGGYVIGDEMTFLGDTTWIVDTISGVTPNRRVKYGYGARRTVKIAYLSGNCFLKVETGDLVKEVPEAEVPQSETAGKYFYVKDGEDISFKVAPFSAGTILDSVTIGETTLTKTSTTEEDFGSYGTYTAYGYTATEIGADTVINVNTGTAKAQVGDTPYLTLEAAIEAAGTTASTVKLLENITEQAVIAAGQTITLDLDGKSITVAGGFAVINNGTLTITGNGAISGKYAIRGTSNSITTIENGTFTAQECAVSTAKNITNATFVINGGTYTTVDNSVLSGNGSENSGGNTWTINGGTFNGGITSANYIACGIYAPNADTWTINGGTFNVTGGCGILARAGNVTIPSTSTVTITTSGTTEGWVGDKKAPVPCAAILFDTKNPSYPAYTTAASIVVAGGTFTSNVAAVQQVMKDGDTIAIAISGGSYSSDVKAFCVSGKTTKAETGMWGTRYIIVDAGIDPADANSKQEVAVEVDTTGMSDKEAQAAVEAAAVAAASVEIPSDVADAMTAAAHTLSEDTYKGYFSYTVTATATPGVYEVKIADLNKEVVFPTSEAATETADLADVLDVAAETPVDITTAKPGLYYSIEAATDLGFTEPEEGDRTLATGTKVSPKKPAVTGTPTAVFYRVKVSTTPNN